MIPRANTGTPVRSVSKGTVTVSDLEYYVFGDYSEILL